MGGASSSSLSDSQLKSRLQRMDDYDFEHLIADLWERQGWRATVKQQSVDRGVDIVAEQDDPFPQKWLIQVKCYSGTLGGPTVRQYVSLQHRPGVDGAIVVSSGPFSKQARQEEKDHNLKLIDGDALVSMIRNTGSYDLIDQYITVPSEQVSSDSSYSSEPPEVVESSTDSRSYLYREYNKHLSFIDLITNNPDMVDIDLVTKFIDFVMEDSDQVERSDPQYQRIKQDLQESIRGSNVILRELKNTPPSSEFERTMELYRRYIQEVEIVNSELEMLIEDYWPGFDVEELDELLDSLNSLEELNPKLSRSIENDLEEINAFDDNLTY